MLFSVAFAVNAATPNNRIYSETVTAKKGSSVEVPVKIENNTGIMGLAIEITYDSKVLTPVSAVKSDSLSGMFDDSIETSDAGSFRVVYTGSENFDFDGTLFTLKFNVSADAAGATSIDLSYSKADTFDVKYKDVDLNCESVSISFKDDSTQPTEPEDPSTEPGEEELKLSVRIKNWAAGLASPLNSVMSVLVAPVVMLLQVFGL